MICDISSYHITILFFFFNDTATTEIYTLSLHDALPISVSWGRPPPLAFGGQLHSSTHPVLAHNRSEEHTSELQSLRHLVCRLLLEKKKKVEDLKYGRTDYSLLYALQNDNVEVHLISPHM